jgi:c-di-GMP-related signal transduction protein
MQVLKANIKQISIEDIQWYLVYHGYKPIKINKKLVVYTACLQKERKSCIKKLLKRKPLCELLVNTTKKPHSNKDFKRPQ